MIISKIELTKSMFNKVELYPKYQPIVSVTKGRIIGFEGLIRGVKDNRQISPKELFEIANKTDKTLELDRLCRDEVLNNFVINNKDYNNYYLFINIDTSIIEAVEGSNYLFNQVLASGICPENVVIEINESSAEDTEKLLSFVCKYKSLGFIIALDDLGTGFSNLERIPIIKPDIIKLDRSLITNIESDIYKQEIKSLVRLANKIGSIVVAEGIETETEAYIALECGVHLMQGYYFSKPEGLNDSFENIDTKINKISNGFKNHMKKKVKDDETTKRVFEIKIGVLLEQLNVNSMNLYDLILEDFIKISKKSQIDCAYILNEFGEQISNTIFYNYKQDTRKKLLFHPATIGTDHSLKEYFYSLVNSKTNKYYSEPYISMATGNVCVTLTLEFKNSMNIKNILCIDYKYK